MSAIHREEVTMGQEQHAGAGTSRRGVLAAAGAAVSVGMGVAMATPATAATAANGLVETRFLSGWGGIACVEFNINDMLAQGNLVCDVFVATGSTSPVIQATGGAIGSATVSPWHATRHVTNILCQPYTQGGRPGVRLRFNFVGDNPQRDTTQRVTIFQAGAQYFASPERTSGVPA